MLWHWRTLLTFNQSVPPPADQLSWLSAGLCRWLAPLCCNLATSDTVHYAEITVLHCALLPAALWTLPFTHHIFILANSLSVLKFPLSGKLLQTVKLLTCVRGTSSSWTTAFQCKNNKLHTECKSYYRLWHVQYCVSASFCCCSNLYTRITEHDNNLPYWMKDISWLHQEWSVQ